MNRHGQKPAFLHANQAIVAGLVFFVLLILNACGGSGSSGDGAPSTSSYGHPGATGATGGSTAGGTTGEAPLGRLSRLAEGKSGEDFTIELATTSVTIRSGTFQENYQALLTDLAGEITDSPSLKLLSLPIRLRVTDTKAILERTAAARDFEFRVTGAKLASIYKAVILLVDYGEARESGATVPVKHFLRLSQMGASASTNGDGNLVASFRVRSGDVGVVMALASNGNPAGYATYTPPPVDPDSVAADAVYPDRATVTWRAQKISNYGFSVAYGVGPTTPLCGSTFDATATETSATPTTDSIGNTLYEYTTQLSALDENKTYAIRVCAADSKSPPTYSGPGAMTTVTTPKRAVAVLANTPGAYTKNRNISVTVGGDGVTEYKYVITLSANCGGAIFPSSWTSIASTLSGSSFPDGTHRLCVLGKISATNEQLIPTDFFWVVDNIPPTINAVPLIVSGVRGPSGGINIALRTANSVVHGPASVTGASALYYKGVPSVTDCSMETYLGAVGELVKSGSFSADGSYKICVKAMDQAGNIAFDYSADFIVDVTAPTAPQFTLANEAVGGFIKRSDKDSLLELSAVVAPNEPTSNVSYAAATSASDCISVSSYVGHRVAISDPVLATDGSYKVCAKMTDTLGNVGYAMSAVVVRDTVEPNYVSGLVWFGSAADGYLNLMDRSGSASILTVAVANEASNFRYLLIPSAAVCSASTYINTSVPNANTANITSDGSYKGCAEITDSAGNIGYWSSASNLTVDTVPPTATITLVNAAAANGLISAAEHISNSLGMSDPPLGDADIESFTYKLIPKATTCGAMLTGFGDAVPAANSAAMVTDGVYVICARVLDHAQNVSYISSPDITLDMAAPSLTSATLDNQAANGYINDSEKAETGNLISAATGSETSAITYVVASSSATCSSVTPYASGIPTTADSALATDGTFKVCVKMVDPAGNIGYGASLNFIRDTRFPAISAGLVWTGDATNLYVNDAEKNGSTALVTAGVPDETADIAYSIVAAAGTCNAILTYNALPPSASHAAFSADGSYKACAVMTDTAGNTTYATSSANVTRDTLAPAATMTLVNAAAANGLISAAEHISNSLGMSDPPLGDADIESFTYKLIPKATTCGALLTGFGDAVPAANSAAMVTDGVYVICARVLDHAQNVSYISSPDVTLDMAAPSLTSATLDNQAANGYINDSEKAETGNLISAATASETSAITYIVASSSATCSSVTPYASGIPTTADSALATDGTFKVCVKMVDPAGNSGYGASLNFIRDTTAPTLVSGLSLTGDGTDGYINSAERSNITAIATAPVANESSSYQYILISAAESCSIASGYGGTIPSGVSADFGADGSYKICSEMTDLAGNKSYVSSASFVLDTAPPTATTSLINAATGGLINAAEFSSNALALVSAPIGNESLSAISYKLILLSTSCGPSITFGSSIPAANSGDFTLDGSYKVCMRVVDAAGNVGFSVSPTIVFDTTSPTFIGAITLANEASDSFINNVEKSAVNDLIGSVSSGGATATDYVVVAGSATCSATSGYVSSIPKINDAGMTADGSWKVCVRLMDSAGNTSYASSATITRDTVAPTLAGGLAWTGSAWDNFLNGLERLAAVPILTAAIGSESSSYKYLLIASSGACSAATYTSTSIPLADSALLNSDGAYKGCVEITDSAGNIGYESSASNLTVDTVSPSANMAFANAAATDGVISSAEHASSTAAMGSVPVGSSDLAAATYKLIPTNTTCGSALSFAGGIPGADSADFTADGTYVICMRLIDNAGNVGFSSSSNLTLDTSPPTLSSISLANDAADGYINSLESVGSDVVTSSATASESATITYVVASTSTACAAQSGYSATRPGSSDSGFTGDGSWKVCVKMVDAAGNTGYGSSPSMVRDTVGPMLASGLAWVGPASDGYLNSSERLLSTAIVTAAVASESSTFQYLTMLSNSPCSGGSFVSASLPGANTGAVNADGLWKVCVKITDLAGNVGYGATSTSVSVDTTAPALTTFPLINDAADGYIINAERTSALPMAGPLSASPDLLAAAYKLVPSSTSCGVALSFGGSIPTAVSADFGSDQNYFICIRLEDNSGNVAYASSTTIILDTIGPVFTSVSLANSALDGYINDGEKASSAAVAGSVISSGAFTTQYAIALYAAPCSSATGYGISIPLINDLGFSGDGAWKVCVKLADVGGNVTYGASAEIIRDTVAPALSSALSLQVPAADGYLNSADRTSGNAVVAVASVTEVASIEYTVSTGLCSAAVGFGSSIPSATTSAITGDGTWKVCVKMIDSAGNIAFDSSANITVDTSGPIFTSIALVNGAADGYLSGSEFSSGTNLAGSLVASGYVTEDYKLVGSATTCGTPLTFGGMPKSDSSDFSGDGSYKVCVRLVDSSGNLTYGSTSSFTLDTTLPIFTALVLANTALDGYVNASERSATSGITGTLTASGQNSTEYKVALAVSECLSLNGWSLSAPLANDAGITADNTWKVCVKLSDTAGNITYGASGNFIVDTIFPGLSAPLALAGVAADGRLGVSDLSSSSAVLSTPSLNESATVTYILALSSASCSSGSGWNGSIPLANAFGISPFNSDGTYVVCVRAVDAAGNVAYHASPSMVRDTAGPSFTSLALANAASDGFLNAAERTLITNVADSLVAEVGSTASYAAVSSVATCNNSLTYASTVQLANDGAFATDGTFKICVKLLDAAGNDAYGSSANFVVDTTPASFVSVSLAGVAADGFLSFADRASPLAIVGDPSSIGADATYYSVITGGATCNATAVFDSADVKPFSNAAAITGDGFWKVCIKVTDIAGNPAAYGVSSSFFVDTASPEAIVTSIGSLSISSTPGSTTNLEGTISDASPSAGISGVNVSVEGFNGNCLNNSKTDFSSACPNYLVGSATSTTWSLPVDDAMFLNGATYSVSVKATDLAGNQQVSAATGSLTWSAPEGTDMWNKNVTFNGSNAAQALASAVDGQGRLVVVGYDTSGVTRGRVKRYTRHGIEDASLDITIGDGSNNYVAYGVAVGALDSVFVVGSKYNGSNNDWFIKKYSSTGVEDISNWDKTYNGSRNDDDIAYSIAIASDGSVVVGGHSKRSVTSSSGDDWRIVKYSSTGVLSCAETADLENQRTDDRIRALVIRNATSRIYVAGYSDAGVTSRGWALGEFNLNTCALLNHSLVSRGASDEAYSIALDSSGQLVVAGKTSEYAGTTPDPWVEVMNTSFASVCAIHPDASAVSEAFAVALDSMDNIYVGGYKTGSNENWWLRKFSSSCTEDTVNWNKTVNGTGNGADRIQSISISAGVNDIDNVYAVGWGYGAVSASGNNDWWVKKYSGVP